MPKQEAKILGDGQVIERLPREKDEELQEFLQRVKNSGRGYKARLTIATKSAERLIAAVGKLPTPAGITQLLDATQEINACGAAVMDLSLIHI